MDRGAERGGGGGGGGGVRSSSPLIASCDRQWRWCAKGLEKNEPVRFFPPAVRNCDGDVRLVGGIDVFSLVGFLFLEGCNWEPVCDLLKTHDSD